MNINTAARTETDGSVAVQDRTVVSQLKVLTKREQSSL